MKEPIGFLPCRACGEVKNVYQGEGRNAAFLYAKCGCGTDTRKGATVQNRLAAHMTREEAEKALTNAQPPQDNAQSEAQTESEQTPPQEQKKVPASALGWAGFAVVTGFALMLRKMRAA
ncbi:hypothetical protein [Vibrio vulnificus]|uniref:hypothetical protein n=1 Tax=Vibrio vulnificus TaxID=672 RepID=UPI0005F1037A|nr:hypothetical protein [Vibrio vulnificus]EHT4939544.1 hypothetical protein [Vibrio vulnificus]